MSEKPPEKSGPIQDQTTADKKRLEKIANLKIDDKPYLFALDKVEATLKNFSGTDIATMRETLQNAKVTEEESAAVQRAMDVLNAVRALQDKVSVLKRATRHLEEITRARLIFERLPQNIKPPINENIIHAIRYLADAVYAVANREEQKGVGKLITGMDEEELKKKREELKKIKVT